VGEVCLQVDENPVFLVLIFSDNPQNPADDKSAAGSQHC
jgi:hypothetical protein